MAKNDEVWEEVETTADGEWEVVQGHKLPNPKLPLPMVEVTGSLQERFQRLINGLKTKERYDERANTDYLKRVLVERGPVAFERAYEAQNRTWGEVPRDAMIFAGRETDKLYSGAQNMDAFLRATVVPFASEEKAYEDRNRIVKEQEEKDILFREMDENQGLAGIGASLPYVVTGAVGGRTAKAAAEGFVNTAERMVVDTARAGRGAFVRGVNRAAASGTPYIAPLAQRAKTEFVDHIAREAARRAAQLPIYDPYRRGMLGDIIGGGLMSAAEDTLHIDRNPIGGFVSGILGSTTGKAIEMPFLRAPVYWDPHTEQPIIDFLKDQGMRLTPGMQTGSRRLQRFEHGITEFDPTADYMGQINRHNQLIANRTAARAIGMPNADGSAFAPNQLSEHLENLSREYEDIVSGTKARLERNDLQNLVNTYQSLVGNKSPDAKKAYNTIKAYVDQLRAASLVTRGPNGRFQAATVDGPNVQRIRRQLKLEHDGAVHRGNLVQANALRDLMTQVDNSVRRGLNYGGTITPDHWDNLNERYALANLLMEDGMTPLGNVNLHKLGNHFLSTDARRMLTESGDEGITTLQRLAKGDYIARNQAGSGLSGTGIKANHGNQTLMQKFLQGSWTGRMPILPRMYMSMYLRGIPSTKGIAGFLPWFEGATGTGAFPIHKVVRAGYQGYDPHNERLRALGQYLPETMTNFIEGITDPK